MHTLPDTNALSDPAMLWPELARSLEALLGGEHDAIANAANTAALIWHGVPELNWAGFYLLQGDTLVLGPFQGKPACVRIPLGRGVCGTAAARRETVVVPDVHAFPGHIACDSASNSEIVIPLFSRPGDASSTLLGVLDLDSPLHARFGAAEQAGLEALARIYERSLQAAAG
ncbi:MAG: GAF domain-containing protein [Steroidobacteraceae bacterium]